MKTVPVKTLMTTLAIALMVFAFNASPAMAGDQSKPWTSNESVDELKGLDKEENETEVVRYEPDCRWKWRVDPNTGNWGWVCEYYSEGEVPGDNVAWDTEPGGNVYCWKSVGKSGPITVCAPDDAWNSENGESEIALLQPGVIPSCFRVVDQETGIVRCASVGTDTQFAGINARRGGPMTQDRLLEILREIKRTGTITGPSTGQNEGGEGEQLASWMNDEKADQYGDSWFNEASGDERELALGLRLWCEANPDNDLAICDIDWWKQSGNESKIAYRIELWCEVNPDLHAAFCANDWWNESGSESEIAYRLELWCGINPDIHAAFCINDWWKQYGSESKIAYRLELWCEVNPDLHAAFCANDWWNESGNESEIAYRIEAWCGRNPDLHAAICANDWWNESGSEGKIAYRLELWCEVNPDLYAAFCANDWWNESENESEIAYRIEAWCGRNPDLHAALCANEWWNDSGNQSEVAYRIEAWCEVNPDLHAALCANDWWQQSGNESEIAYRIEAWCGRNPDLHAVICANDWWNESANESEVAYRIEAWCEVNPDLHAALCAHDWWQQSGNESQVAGLDGGGQEFAYGGTDKWRCLFGDVGACGRAFPEQRAPGDLRSHPETQITNLMSYCQKHGNCMMFEDKDQDGTFEIVGKYHDSRSLDLSRDRKDYNEYLKSFAYGGCKMRNDGAVVCPGDAWNSDYPDSDSTDGFGGRSVADSGDEGSTSEAGQRPNEVEGKDRGL